MSLRGIITWLPAVLTVLVIAIIAANEFLCGQLAATNEATERLVKFGIAISFLGIVVFSVCPILRRAVGGVQDPARLPWRSQTLALPVFGAIATAWSVLAHQGGYSDSIHSQILDIGGKWGLSGQESAVVQLIIVGSLALSIGCIFSGFFRVNYVVAFILERSSSQRHPVWELVSQKGVSKRCKLLESFLRIGVVVLSNFFLWLVPLLFSLESLKIFNSDLATSHIMIPPLMLALGLTATYLMFLAWDKLVLSMPGARESSDVRRFIDSARKFHLSGLGASLIFVLGSVLVILVKSDLWGKAILLLYLMATIVFIRRFLWSLTDIVQDGFGY